MILAPSARWWKCGAYRVLAMPLPLNPAWTTHRIYRGRNFCGAQLSVPNESDCAWLERTSGRYAESSGTVYMHSFAIRRELIDRREIRRKGGRKSRAESERMLAEAMDA